MLEFAFLGALQHLAAYVIIDCAFIGRSAVPHDCPALFNP